MNAEFQLTEAGTLARCDFSSPLHAVLTCGQNLTEEFEWEDLRAAIADAAETFTILEIGAGYGRWAVAGVTMAQKRGLQALAICVEAEPDHFRMMRQHFIDNGLDPGAHRLIEAVATNTDRDVYFVIGHASDWYGQAILPSPDHGYGNWPDAKVVTVPGLSLGSIIGETRTVDFLDMDVQGEEFAVLRSSRRLLNERVKMVHIATHNPKVEADLRRFFRALGWQCRHDFGCLTEADTKYGRIQFLDGVQSWKNPKLASESWRDYAYSCFAAIAGFTRLRPKR